jgi:hypothetical protein
LYAYVKKTKEEDEERGVEKKINRKLEEGSR